MPLIIAKIIPALFIGLVAYGLYWMLSRIIEDNGVWPMDRARTLFLAILAIAILIIMLFVLIS